MTKAIPEGFHSVTPMFTFKDARKAIEFYKHAFGAQERFAMPGPDGKGVMHAELLIGDSIIMMGEENPQQACKSAETLGASPVSFYILPGERRRGLQQSPWSWGRVPDARPGDVLGGPGRYRARPLRLQLDAGHPHQGPDAA